ncbi:MAG: metal-dependent hydrolase [Planctomycetota bacterium]
MNTPTHVLINWTIAKASGGKFPASAVLLGALAPDIPLYFLSIGGGLWFRFVEGWEPGEIARHMFGTLFYEDPYWISLHNCLHSPLVLLGAIAVLHFAFGKTLFLKSWWTWFFGSCLLHTLVDIPVHHDDGPLVFWPLNWSYRFASPLSYWDLNHYAQIVMPFEAVLAIVLLANILLQWWSKKEQRDG